MEKIFSTQALIQASDEEPLKEASCKISTRSDNYYGSYAIFSFFHLVGWLVWLDCITFLWLHQNLGKGPLDLGINHAKFQWASSNRSCDMPTLVLKKFYRIKLQKASRICVRALCGNKELTMKIHHEA